MAHRMDAPILFYEQYYAPPIIYKPDVSDAQHDGLFYINIANATLDNNNNFLLFVNPPNNPDPFGNNPNPRVERTLYMNIELNSIYEINGFYFRSDITYLGALILVSEKKFTGVYIKIINGLLNLERRLSYIKTIDEEPNRRIAKSLFIGRVHIRKVPDLRFKSKKSKKVSKKKSKKSLKSKKKSKN